MISLLEISRTHLFLCYLYYIMAWKLKTRHCSQTQQILSNHTLQIVVSPRSNKMDVWDWVAARGFYSVSHCLRSRVFLNGRIIFRRDILFYSNSEGSHESDPCTDVVTLLASHWSTKTDVTISLAERGTGRQVNQHRRGSWGCVKIKVKTVKTLWGRFCFS